MGIERAKDVHIWERDPYDWYVEPVECSVALFEEEEFSGPIWDPACGIGRIVESARQKKLEAIGSDIIKRSKNCSFTLDFTKDQKIIDFRSIISNPPFSCAEKFVRKSIEILPIGGKAAFLLPLVWMAGFSMKRDWLPVSPLKAIHVISPRPSMPPGQVILAGVTPGNGTKDFAWFVWEKGHIGKPQLHFMNTNLYKIRRNRKLL